MPSNANETILVTGSDGLIGWHLRAWLLTLGQNVETIACNREQFNDDAFLGNAIEKADVIVHLAGMNRGEEDEIVETNIALARRITEFCQQLDCRPHVIYSNSTHINGDSRYGYSKRVAAEIFDDWASSEDARFLNLVLPNVFGEHGTPNYNSVVSTFSYKLAVGETPNVIEDSELELLHAHLVARIIWRAVEEQSTGLLQPSGHKMLVSELLQRLEFLSDRYQSGVLPDLSNDIDLNLFNTLRSYIPYERRLIRLDLRSDSRGSLFECVRADGEGQVFLSTSVPGAVRGQHFHFHKVERFLVVQGNAKIQMRRVLKDESFTYEVSGDEPAVIDIPTLHTHSITNTGDIPLLTLFWSGQLYDPDDSDTSPLSVDFPPTQDNV